MNREDIQFAYGFNNSTKNVYSKLTHKAAVESNKQLFSTLKVPVRQYDSLSFRYLLNFNRGDKLGNSISINEYNYSGIALKNNQLRKLSETLDDAIHLTPSDSVPNSFCNLSERVSVRHFKKNRMTLRDLSDILHFSGGVKDSDNGRFYPSPGGLYPISLYMYIRNTEVVSNGLYKYQPVTNTLKPIKQNTVTLSEAVETIYGPQLDLENFNVILFFKLDLFSIFPKYGDMALAFSFMECGFISQLLHLTANATGYGMCDLGSYKKTVAERLLNMDGLSEQVVHAAILGKK